MKPGNGKDDRYYDEAAPSRSESKPEHGIRLSAQEAIRRASALGKGKGAGILARPGLLIAAGLVGLLILATISYLLVSSSSRSKDTIEQTQGAAQTAQQQNQAPPPPTDLSQQGNATQNTNQAQPPTGPSGQTNQFAAPQSRPASSPVAPPESEPAQRWPVRIATVALSLALASLLGAVLAFRPRRDLPIARRRPQIIQAEILLAVLGASVMLVASASLAIAAGVIAMAFFVKVTPSLRDPKESSVMLISAAIGVASGAERWEVGLILTLLAFIILWVLEYPESRRIERSLEVTVRTRNVNETNDVLREIFERNRVSAEFRRSEAPYGTDPGSIVYEISSADDTGIDQLTDEIFSSDPANVAGLDWREHRTPHL